VLVDLGAHLTGFAAGLALGIGVAMRTQRTVLV